MAWKILAPCLSQRGSEASRIETTRTNSGEEKIRSRETQWATLHQLVELAVRTIQQQHQSRMDRDRRKQLGHRPAWAVPASLKLLSPRRPLQQVQAPSTSQKHQRTKTAVNQQSYYWQHKLATQEQPAWTETAAATQQRRQQRQQRQQKAAAVHKRNQQRQETAAATSRAATQGGCIHARIHHR